MTKVLLHELGKSVSFGRLSLLGKVLWPMLLAASDDQGRGQAEADVVKWSVCPNVPELTIENIPALLQEMVDQAMLHVYTDGRGRILYQTVRWWEYQSLQWAQPSRYEAPENWADRIRANRKGIEFLQENWEGRGGFGGWTIPNDYEKTTGNTEENPPENVGENPPGNTPGQIIQSNSIQSNSIQLNLTKENAPAALKPSPPDIETATWIHELESIEPPPHPPPRSEEELRQATQAASLAYAARIEGEPWLTWGAQSKEALRQFERALDSADDVRRLGWELEDQFGLVPLWAKPKDVKRWVSELCNCLEVARGDVDVVLAAASKLRKDKFTVGGPWSLVNTARALAAERQSAGTSERALRQRYASEGVLT